MFERSKKDPADAGKSADSGRDSDRETHGWTQGSTTAASAHGRSDIAVIGRSIRINGDLCGEEDLRIEGNVTGTVQLKNNTPTILVASLLGVAGLYAASVGVIPISRIAGSSAAVVLVLMLLTYTWLRTRQI